MAALPGKYWLLYINYTSQARGGKGQQLEIDGQNKKALIKEVDYSKP